MLNDDHDDFISFIIACAMELFNDLVFTIESLILIFDILIFDIIWILLQELSNDFIKIEHYYYILPKYINKRFNFETGEFKLSITDFINVIIDSGILKASDRIVLFLSFFLFFLYSLHINWSINMHVSDYLNYNPRTSGYFFPKQLVETDLYYKKPYLIQKQFMLFFLILIPIFYFSCLVHSLWYGVYSFHLINIGKLITVSTLFYTFSLKSIICFIIFRDLTIIFYLNYKCPSDYDLTKKFSSYEIAEYRAYFIKKHSSWIFFIKYNLLISIIFFIFILIPYIFFYLTGPIPLYSSKTLIKELIKQSNFFYSKTYLFTEPSRVMHNDFKLNKTATFLINTEHFYIYIKHIYYSIIVSFIVSSQILCAILTFLYFLYVLLVFFILIREKNIVVIIVTYFTDHVDRDSF